MSLHEQRAPGRSLGVAENSLADADRRRAGTFFMVWLILAASMSLAGNVGHALLIAPSETRWLAALAALVPPIVLLAATHSATWLVRARSVGWVYWVALALTAALALGSFALSFDALRSFAMMLGIRESMSWIWPAVIDVAIAHATLCLLSLTRPKLTNTSSRQTAEATTAPGSATNAMKVHRQHTQTRTLEMAQELPEPVPPQLPMPSVDTAPMPTEGLTEDAPNSAEYSTDTVAETTSVNGAARVPSAPLSADTATQAPRRPERALSAVPAAEYMPPRNVSPGPAAAEPDTECGAAVDRWQPVAESLVREGITNKDPDLIAKILADSAAGTPPSTIGRRHEVHHTTVSRILSAAEQLAEASTATG